MLPSPRLNSRLAGSFDVSGQRSQWVGDVRRVNPRPKMPRLSMERPPTLRLAVADSSTRPLEGFAISTFNGWENR